MLIKLRRAIYITFGHIGNLLFYNSYKITIFCYHSIDSTLWNHGISKHVFEKQIKILSNNYKFWNLYDLIDHIKNNGVLDSNKAIITFDDGYKNIMQILNVTDRYDVRPTVFVIADSSFRNYRELDNHKQLLSDDDIKTLALHGWSIGSHTSTHPNLSKLKSGHLSYELKNSKLSIEKRIGVRCDFIAYPKGKYDDYVLSNSIKSGYVMGLTMDDGFINTKTNLFRIPRVGINRSHSEIEFKYLDSPLNVVFRKFAKYLIYEK